MSCQVGSTSRSISPRKHGGPPKQVSPSYGWTISDLSPVPEPYPCTVEHAAVLRAGVTVSTRSPAPRREHLHQHHQRTGVLVLRTHAGNQLRSLSQSMIAATTRRSDLLPPCLPRFASAARPFRPELHGRETPHQMRPLPDAALQGPAQGSRPCSRPCRTPSRWTRSLNSFALSYISSSSVNDIISARSALEICHASAAPATHESSAWCNSANSGPRPTDQALLDLPVLRRGFALHYPERGHQVPRLGPSRRSAASPARDT